MFLISSSAVALTIGAGLSFAAFDVLRKFAAKDFDPSSLLIYQLVGQLPIFAAWVMISGDYVVQHRYFPLGVVAILIGVSANLIFLKALQISPLSITIPVLSLTPVFTTLFGVWILGEYPTTVQAVGIGLTCVGVLLINVRSFPDGMANSLRRFTVERGVPLMAIVALLWSINGPIHKELLEYASVPVHALIQLSGSIFLLICWRAKMAKRKVSRPSKVGVSWAVAASATGGLAYGLQLLAFEVTLVAIVESVKRVVGQISALVVGRLAFREPITVAKMGAIASLCAGVPLIWVPL